LRIDFEKRVVAHARKLKKVEVKQLNAVLNEFVEKERKNGREASR
jgi:flagellar motor switch protein FliG